MIQGKNLLTIGTIAFILALAGLIVTMGGIDLTGYQTTDSGNASIEITENVQINFTTDSINWGSGRVDTSATHATLDSEGTVTNSTEDPWNTVNQPLVLENLGNVNATIQLSTGSDASTFIGGGAANDAPNPEYNWKVGNNEAGSCINATPTSYSTVDTSSPGTTVCDPLKFADANDEMTLDIEILVPYDAPVESKTDTITATATAA